MSPVRRWAFRYVICAFVAFIILVLVSALAYPNNWTLPWAFIGVAFSMLIGMKVVDHAK